MKAVVKHSKRNDRQCEISIDCNGLNYYIIIGKYINGGFFAIPNHGVGGDLSDFTDTFWNAESIGNVLNNLEVGKALAKVIKDMYQ